jgi:succinyl-diaminopimelate desuccinylase
MLDQYILKLLNTESPTFQEDEIQQYVKDELHKHCPNIKLFESKGSIIACDHPFKPNKPHISLVGHTDVVPAFFKAYQEGDQLHGAGASDMKAAVGVFLYLFTQHPEIRENYNLSFISYVREEGTPLHDNGLYSLIESFPDYFNSIDLAIVGEPTNNTIQVGCVGSIHCVVKIPGQSAHSARPWDGENALYNAVPFINTIKNLKKEKHTIFGVDFFDVISITESHSEKGRTSVPGEWQCNINYRFAPTKSLEEAKQYLYDTLKNAGLEDSQFSITDAVYAGNVVESEAMTKMVKKIGAPIEAKQAWTDVAQLSKLGIAAFNYGPGLTAQAHKPNEYIRVSDIHAYAQTLLTTLQGDS